MKHLLYETVHYKQLIFSTPPLQISNNITSVSFLLVNSGTGLFHFDATALFHYSWRIICSASSIPIFCCFKGGRICLSDIL